MGRLQRKKPASAKKKKKQRIDAAEPSGTQSGVAAKKVPALSVSSKEVTKKQPPSHGKALTRTEPGKIKSYWDEGIQFLREVKVELKKVTWPTRKQTIGSTVVVIILVMIISIFLGVVDMGLSSLVRVVLK